MSLTTPHQHSDNCNWDADDNRAYGSTNAAERGPKWGLLYELDADGMACKLRLVQLTEEMKHALYLANERYRRTAPPVDPAEIEWPVGCTFDVLTQRPLAWLEMQAAA